MQGGGQHTLNGAMVVIACYEGDYIPLSNKQLIAHQQQLCDYA